MKKIFLLLAAIMLTSQAVASQCFIAKEQDQIITQQGDCAKRYAPCSTFKIALSLIGYDAGILIDTAQPKWPFQPGYLEFLESWKQDQTPQSWMKTSCVWYSQILTQKLGMEKFQAYVNALNYGNMDLTGDKGKNNGLTNAWLSSSLEISSLEQIAFLEKLLKEQLPVTKHAHAMTKNILFVEELLNGWKLYAKTGSGFILSPDRIKKLEIQHGWYIGWIEKGDKKIIFSNHITDDKKEDNFASLRAKADAKERLSKIILQMENNKQYSAE